MSEQGTGNLKMSAYRGICYATKLMLAAATVYLPSIGVADNVFYLRENQTVNLGEETYINRTGSKYRFIAYEGTVNLNDGAYIKSGGNTDGNCNYIGVDEDTSAVMTINGGTFWCSNDGDGKGCLGIGINNKGVSSSLTLNSGLLRVDGQVRLGTNWQGLGGVTSSGTLTINGGEAIINELNIGSTSASTGSSSLILNDGILKAKEIVFHEYNGQCFTWKNGTIAATCANTFSVKDYIGEKGKTRTMEITGEHANFETSGFDQLIPSFSGTGRLRLSGGGTVTFADSSLSYGLSLDGITVNLGSLNAETVPLTVRSLLITGNVIFNVALPQSPTGRYPLIVAITSFSGSVGSVSVVGGGVGKVVRDENTLYLSFEEEGNLVYSDAAGGMVVPELAAYMRLAFENGAGAFTVGGDGISLGQDMADMSVSKQTVSAPVTLSANNSYIYVDEKGVLELSGGLDAVSPIKDGRGTLLLSKADAVPSGMVLSEGTLDLGGNTYSGDLNFSARRYYGEETILTNGTWRPVGKCDLYFHGRTIVIADGCTCDLTQDKSSRVAIGYKNNQEKSSTYSTLVVDGGSVICAGNVNTTCNFVGVDNNGTAVLDIRGGLFHAKKNPGEGHLRIAVNNNPHLVGIVRVNGGTLKVDGALTMATSFQNSKGGTAKAIFTLYKGLAQVDEFYVGAVTETTGRGVVILTGGVLEVGKLHCYAHNRQTLTADGATIRATKSSPMFMYADESADSHVKTYTIGSGGLTVDTAGYDVRCNIPWTGTGDLKVMGEGGSLALDGEPLFTGDVVISAGATLSISNSAAFAGKMEFLGADSKLRIDTTLFNGDSLVVSTGGFSLPSGVTDVLDLVEIVGGGYVASVLEDGKSIELALSENVAAFAWWTGGGDPTNLNDPLNWACTNLAGMVVENATPIKSTVVVLSGNASFRVPSGFTPVWSTTQLGYGGAVTLCEDCDWSMLPNLRISDGSHLDLNGHNLKVSYISAVDGYDGAYVTNSATGVKSVLWTESAFSETEYIDTAKVHVFTDCVEVKSVNGETFASSSPEFASMLDASCIVTGGVMNVDASTAYIGGGGHDALLCVSGKGTAQFENLRVGNIGDSGSGRVVVADSATLKALGYLTVGHRNDSGTIFTQGGGVVSVGADCNIGVGNSVTARYEMNAGTLTVGRSLAIGRSDTIAGHGEFLQSGGSVISKTYLSVGYGDDGEGSYIMTGGTFDITANRVNVGSEFGSKKGILDVSGGVFTADKGINIGRDSGGVGVLRLSGDGCIVTADIKGGAGANLIELDGGTLIAKNVAEDSVFLKDLTNIVFKTGGVTLDASAAGRDIQSVGCVMRVAPGVKAITLKGGNSFDFTDTVLDLTGKFERGFVLAQATGDGIFTGLPSLAKGVRGCRIALSDDCKTISLESKGFIIHIH